MTEAVHDRHDDLKLHNAIDKLVEKGEQMRVARMNQYRSRSFFTITASILCVMAGAGGFGWFFLSNAYTGADAAGSALINAYEQSLYHRYKTG